MRDVMLRNVPSRRPVRPCEYCGVPVHFRRAGGFVVVPEPTERGTYAEVWRQLCPRCTETYRRVPFGFRLEA